MRTNTKEVDLNELIENLLPRMADESKIEAIQDLRTLKSLVWVAFDDFELYFSEDDEESKCRLTDKAKALVDSICIYFHTKFSADQFMPDFDSSIKDGVFQIVNARYRLVNDSKVEAII